MEIADKLNGHTNVEETNKASLVEYEEVEETPFRVYGSGENKYVVLMGKYRLTNELEKEEAIEYAKKMDWDILLQVMTIIASNTPKDEI